MRPRIVDHIADRNLVGVRKGYFLIQNVIDRGEAGTRIAYPHRLARFHAQLIKPAGNVFRTIDAVRDVTRFACIWLEHDCTGRTRRRARDRVLGALREIGDDVAVAKQQLGRRLLDGVRQFVRQQSPAVAIFGWPPAGPEENVAATGKGPCADLLGRRMCGLVVMDAHIREVGAAEPGLERRPLGARQKRAGTPVKGSRYGRSGSRRRTRRRDRCGVPCRSLPGQSPIGNRVRAVLEWTAGHVQPERDALSLVHRCLSRGPSRVLKSAPDPQARGVAARLSILPPADILRDGLRRWRV